MTKFRFHRGGLDDSLSTTIEVSSLEDLKLKIKEAMPFVDTDTITVEPYGYDSRTGWDTYIITSDSGAIGFTDGAI